MGFMRRILVAILISLTALPLMGAGKPAAPEFSTQQKADLDRVSDALNAAHSMQGDFAQINPNGDIVQGRFYIQKPGRVRFEYNPPTPTLIVSNGTTVAVKNTKLNTVDRYPLISTPLDFVLSDNLDLKNNKAVNSIERDGDSLIVKASSTDSRAPGTITMVFAEQNLELRQWTVIDAQGLSTTVALRDVEQDVPLPASLFVVEERNPFTKRTD